MALEAALYGTLVIFCVDGLWLWKCVPRFYESIQVNKYSNKITRVIDGTKLLAKVTNNPNAPQEQAGLGEYYETPTANHAVLRFVLFFVNCLVGPLLMAYMVDYGISGARAGALLGFYTYYVFNATVLSISSYYYRDALIDTLYGTVLFTLAALAIEHNIDN